jgi:Mg-chelatase subunit ChlD
MTVSAWMISAVLHAVLIGILAMVVLKSQPARDVQTVVLLEPMAATNVGDTGDDTSLDGSSGGAAAHERVREQTRSEATTAPPRVTPPVAVTGAAAMGVDHATPQNTMAADPAFALLAELAPDASATTAVGQGQSAWLEGTSPGFQQMVGGMRGKGLDIVFVLDATNSMEPYIGQAKDRILDVTNVIVGLLSVNGQPPRNLRFGVVAFKDYGDDYGIQATRLLPLTDNVGEVQQFIAQIRVGGGGDAPEPTHRALAVATHRGVMDWMVAKKNVVILVSDAPVHAGGRADSIRVARAFTNRLQGTINVIDVGTDREEPLGDLARIAEAGKGSAFVLSDEQAFWKYLIVSVFGERFERDVQTIVDRYATSD